MNIRNFETVRTMLSDALRAVPNVTAKEVGLAFQRGDDVGYAILRGEWNKRFARIQFAIASPRAEVADAIISALLAGTKYPKPLRTDIDGDLNGDGAIGPNDVFDGMVRTLQLIAAELAPAKSDCGQKNITPDRAANLKRLFNELFRYVRQMDLAVDECASRPVGPRAASA